MSLYRNDPSSVSFGRLLHQTAATVKQQQREIDSLKQGQLTSQEKQSAQELAAAKRSERSRANQMLSSLDTTLEDYQSLNQTLLTTAQKEQLRHNINGLITAQAFGTPIQFTDEALARINNWKTLAKAAPKEQTFANNNLPPKPPADPRFERWLKNQNSVQGMMHRSKQEQANLDIDQMLTKSKANLNKPRAQGRHIGGIKDLNN